MSLHRKLTGADLHAPSNQQIENTSGSTIPALYAVTFSGTGVYPKIVPVTSINDAVRGVTPVALADGECGYITCLGFINNVNTSAYNVGDKLYASAGGALSTTVFGLPIAYVMKKDATTGILYVTNTGVSAPDLSLLAPVQSVAGKVGAVLLNKSDVGLSNVDNTSDLNKPVSTAQAAADAAVQSFSIQRANHTGTQSVSTITGLAAVATSGLKADVGLSNVDNTSDIDKPVSTAQALADAAVQAYSIQRSNHTGTQSASTITGLATVATSGQFDDLLSRPISSTGQFLTSHESAVIALTDGAIINTDASAGNIFTVTLQGNRTLAAPTGMGSTRQKIIYIIRQDAIGGRTLSFDPVFNFGVDLLGMSLSSSANATDYIGCIYNPILLRWDVVAFVRGY